MPRPPQCTMTDVLVHRQALTKVMAVVAPTIQVPQGHCLLRIEKLALSANNVTYGATATKVIPLSRCRRRTPNDYSPLRHSLVTLTSFRCPTDIRLAHRTCWPNTDVTAVTNLVTIGAVCPRGGLRLSCSRGYLMSQVSTIAVLSFAGFAVPKSLLLL